MQSLSIILFLTLILSVTVVVKKRKKFGITGLKSALTSICFFLIPVINLFAYWFDFMGLFVWLADFILLILAAYFTKYLRGAERTV